MSRLTQLAVNDEGFAFDPATGEVFTCNKTGSFVLRGLSEGKSQQDISLNLARDFEVDPKDADRDVRDFIAHLKILKILS